MAQVVRAVYEDGAFRPLEPLSGNIERELRIVVDPETAYIESTPGVRGGKPRLSGTRITVSDIALMHLQQNQTLDSIAAEYDLSLGAVHTAMAWYYDHQKDVDRSIKEEEQLAERVRHQHRSPLQAKLNGRD